MSKLYNEISWDVNEDSENILEKYLQISIIGWACKYGHNHCIQQSLQRFRKWQTMAKDGDQSNP